MYKNDIYEIDLKEEFERYVKGRNTLLHSLNKKGFELPRNPKGKE